MKDEIILDYKPNIDELVKASFYSIFKNWKIRLTIGIVIVAILYNILFPLFESKKLVFLDFLPLIIVPIMLYFSSKRIYNISKKTLEKDSKLLEKREVVLNNEIVSIIGESFKVNYLWKEFSKIEETNKWFLFYVGDFKVIPVIKSNLSVNQYNELKELFSSINIKKSLM